MAKSIYTHYEETHNLSSPSEIVPELMTLFNPKSVIDLGCGIGTFLQAFKQAGVKEVLGIDGSWANKNLLNRYLSDNEFMEHDLDLSLNLSRRFDLAICLEVGEHLSNSKSEILVSNLIELSDIIIFSAAIPGQDGQHHINEQWPGFWIEKFKTHGYVFCDLLRHKFWDNKNIQWWYKQNTFIIIKESRIPDYPFCKANPVVPYYVHPENYLKKIQKIQMIESGKAPLKTYLKFLLKKIFTS